MIEIRASRFDAHQKSPMKSWNPWISLVQPALSPNFPWQNPTDFLPIAPFAKPRRAAPQDSRLAASPRRSRGPGDPPPETSAPEEFTRNGVHGDIMGISWGYIIHIYICMYIYVYMYLYIYISIYLYIYIYTYGKKTLIGILIEISWDYHRNIIGIS